MSESSLARGSMAVIIPAHKSAHHLRLMLFAIRDGACQPDELIVVDDASEDGSDEIARSLGARVLTMQKSCGPAVCRNIGALDASSEILIFIDADACVQSDTLLKISQHLHTDLDLSAVIGAYDDHPSETGVCSQYRNLAHCFVHRVSRPEALTFWTGCGAVRREAFLDAGGFDERHRRPSTEDIDLGYRLTDRGHRILLDPSVSVTHLKRWTFWKSVCTDVRDRAIPWTLLLLERGNMPNDLNLTLRHRVSTGLTGAALLLMLPALAAPRWGLAAIACVGVALSLHADFFRFMMQRKGRLFLLAAIVLFLAQELCSIAGAIGGLGVWWIGRRGERRSRVGNACELTRRCNTHPSTVTASPENL